MLKKLLVANRGEIVARIARTADRLGIPAVAVFSDADARLPYLKVHESYHLPGSSVSETYLNAEALVSIALRSGSTVPLFPLHISQAVHPGYGFLSENAEFSALCRRRGLLFVGPTAEVMRLMGLKGAAKEFARGLSIPVLDFYSGSEQSLERIRLESERIGYPVLLKSAAGGGGRGLRVVRRPEDLESEWRRSCDESELGFGSRDVIVEKYLSRPRHIEVQVLGDTQGHFFSLSTRDCSVQRKFQKIVEEAPAAGLSPSLMHSLEECALRLCRSSGYTGVGTVEFLVDGDHFFFMEMNTRLQVEHCVTEAICGLDLVELQLRVSQGESLAGLSFAPRGHALEVRVLAEDPYRSFLPQSGRILSYRFPSHDCRLESSIENGSEVSSLYDSLLSKLIFWGPDRARCLRVAQTGLRDAKIVGVATNLPFLHKVVSSEDFLHAPLTTNFISDHPELMESVLTDEKLSLAALSLFLSSQSLSGSSCATAWSSEEQLSLRCHSTAFTVNDQLVRCAFAFHCESEISVSINDSPPRSLQYRRLNATAVRVETEGSVRQVDFFPRGDDVHCVLPDGECLRIGPAGVQGAEDGSAGGSVVLPLSGRITRILVHEGDRVRKGCTLGVMEAMKMEHLLVATRDGIVSELHAVEGTFSQEGSVFAKLRTALVDPR